MSFHSSEEPGSQQQRSKKACKGNSCCGFKRDGLVRILLSSNLIHDCKIFHCGV
jgi:hypothetical protein